jgi:hypothetical protein
MPTPPNEGLLLPTGITRIARSFVAVNQVLDFTSSRTVTFPFPFLRTRADFRISPPRHYIECVLATLYGTAESNIPATTAILR